MTDDADSTALAGADVPDEVAESSWAIHSVGEADWALERVAQAKRELAEIDAQFDAAVRRLEERRDALRKQPQRTVDFFSAHLRLWAEPQKGAICSGRRKSKALLHGRVGWACRKPLKLVVKDEAAFTAWAQAEGHGREEWVTDMPAVRAAFKVTGSIPPGCDTEGGEDTFYIETEGE